MMLARLLKSGTAILLFGLICIMILHIRFPLKHQYFLSFDRSGYHLYLPAVFIYKDVSTLSFYPEIDAKYHPAGDIAWYSIYNMPDGKRLNKYATGVACMELPFFIPVHLYTIYTHTYPPDGYSVPYQYAFMLSNIFWCVAGLWVLHRLLRRYFTDKTVMITVLCLALGTNLFWQTAYEPASHAYSFFLTSCILYLTDSLYKKLKTKYLYWLAVVLGFSFIVRPTNILLITIPLFWEVDTLKDIINFKKIYSLTIAGCLFVMVILLQLGYWKYITGHWVFFSYVGERFDFLHPNIINGLFSFRKGWYIYTPIAFLSTIGLILSHRYVRNGWFALVFSAIAAIYVVFSWTNWWYGGGFSARAMIDFLPVFSFGLASLIHTFKQRGLWQKATISSILTFFVILNLFQTWQYDQGIIHYNRMTRAYYWRVFGQIKYNEANTQYLMDDHTYWQEMKKAYH